MIEFLLIIIILILLFGSEFILGLIGLTASGVIHFIRVLFFIGITILLIIFLAKFLKTAEFDPIYIITPIAILVTLKAIAILYNFISYYVLKKKNLSQRQNSIENFFYHLGKKIRSFFKR